MRGVLLALAALVTLTSCGGDAPTAAVRDEGPTGGIAGSEPKAGGSSGGTRPEARIYRSMLIYGLDHPTIASKSPPAVARILDDMGLNHVVFGGLPYAAEPFNSIVAELQRRGIKVYGECTQFVGWDDDVPDSRPTNARGEPFPQVRWYRGANPSVPEVFERALDKFKAVVDRHPGLEGVWTDFIRWPIHWEVRDWEEGASQHVYDSSFDDATLARFQAASGVVIPDDLTCVPARAKWIYDNARHEFGRWKVGIILSFLEQAHAYLKAAGEDKVLGAFTVPWKPSQYDNAIINIVGQDYAAMARYVEVFSPMCYHQMMGYSVEWIGEFTTYTRRATGRTTIPIIMGFSIARDMHGVELTPEELYDSIVTAATAEGSDGVMMFQYSGILDENRLDEVVAAYTELGSSANGGGP